MENYAFSRRLKRTTSLYGSTLILESAVVFASPICAQSSAPARCTQDQPRTLTEHSPEPA